MEAAVRGSEKLMAAWRSRTLTEESVSEIAKALDETPGKLDTAVFSGGESATGLHVGLTYDGDDVPICGNDILFWLHWHRKYGGVLVPPRIIINGTPFPDYLRLELDFGQAAGATVPSVEELDLGGANGGF